MRSTTSQEQQTPESKSNQNRRWRRRQVREREPSFVLSRGTGKEEQKKLDKVIIRGKGREGMDLLLLRPYDTRPTNTNHHLGSPSSKEGRETIDCGAGKLGVALLWLGGGGPGFCQKHRLEGCSSHFSCQNEYEDMINILNQVNIQ